MNVITSERLELRELQAGDAGFILALLNEPGFLRFIGDKGVRNEEDAREYMRKGPQASYREHGFGLLATCLRDGTAHGVPGGTPIGICGLVKRDGLNEPDVGFAFLSQYGAKGYAVEAARAVMRHAHETLKLPRVVAIVDADNEKSIRVLEKLGLRYEKTLRLGTPLHDVKLFGPVDGAAS
jgi:ribosomal-protein-alanine N-acetyltransferase